MAEIASTTHNKNLERSCHHVHNLITVKLDRGNYDLWQKQVTLYLTAYQLLSFVDGSSSPPPLTLATPSSSTPQPNPAAVIWRQTDAVVLSNLLSTLSPSLLSKLSHHRTAAAALWSDLRETYTILSVAHIHDLKQQLLRVKKTGSMLEYLDQIQDITDKLAVAGAPLSDIDLVYHTIANLPAEYDALTTLVRNTQPPIAFPRLYSMLGDEEIVVKRKEHMISPDTSNALTAQAQQPRPIVTADISNAPYRQPSSYSQSNRGSFRGRGSRRGSNSRGRFNSRGPRPTSFHLNCVKFVE